MSVETVIENSTVAAQKKLNCFQMTTIATVERHKPLDYINKHTTSTLEKK